MSPESVKKWGRMLELIHLERAPSLFRSGCAVTNDPNAPIPTTGAAPAFERIIFSRFQRMRRGCLMLEKGDVDVAVRIPPPEVDRLQRTRLST